MFDDRVKPKFDPRSPVQPPRSPAPYLIAAVFAAFLIWTAQQYWTVGVGSGQSTTADRQPPQSAAPTRGDIRTIFTADDYPQTALRNGEEGTVQARLAVDAEGRVSACEIVRSSGHETLDRATCSILRQRARFTPARDRNGSAIASSVITPPVRWQLQG